MQATMQTQGAAKFSIDCFREVLPRQIPSTGVEAIVERKTYVALPSSLAMLGIKADKPVLLSEDEADRLYDAAVERGIPTRQPKEILLGDGWRMASHTHGRPESVSLHHLISSDFINHGPQSEENLLIGIGRDTGDVVVIGFDAATEAWAEIDRDPSLDSLLQDIDLSMDDMSMIAEPADDLRQVISRTFDDDDLEM
jgi:hypothetical protein